MDEDSEPSVASAENARPPSNRRILSIMGVIGLGGSLAGIIFVNFGFGIGVLIGVILAFVNYFWLKSSLRKIFAVAQSGERPRMLAGKYFLRYIVLAGIVAVIYASGLVSVVGVILGLAGFGFAVVIDGLIRIFYRPKDPNTAV